ncbi:hypothetical protein ACFLQ1_02290 [Candidatus Auribacterota bacterium]
MNTVRQYISIFLIIFLISFIVSQTIFTGILSIRKNSHCYNTLSPLSWWETKQTTLDSKQNSPKWPDILTQDIDEYAKCLQAISPREAASGNIPPLNVKREDLTYSGNTDNMYPFLYTGRDKKNYIVKTRKEIADKVSMANIAAAHLIGERLFKLLGIPTTESHILEIAEGKKAIIMPAIDKAQEFSERLYKQFDKKQQKLVKAVSLLDKIIANWDRRVENILVVDNKPIFIDTGVAFGIQISTNVHIKTSPEFYNVIPHKSSVLTNPWIHEENSAYFYYGIDDLDLVLWQPSLADTVWMAKRFVLISKEQYKAILDYALNNLPETEFDKQLLLDNFSNAQAECRKLIASYQQQEDIVQDRKNSFQALISA